MKYTNKEYFNPHNFRVVQYENAELMEYIEQNHYLKAWATNAQLCFGLIKTDENRRVGAQIFGEPGRADLFKSLSPLLTARKETLELQRGFVDDGHGTNAESWFVSQCFRAIKEIRPQVRVIVSYADPSRRNSTDADVAHFGRIYQALNGIFLPTLTRNTFKSYSISLSDPNGPHTAYHSRSMSWMLGSHNVKELARKIGKTYWRRLEANKYRYVWVLDRKGDKALYDDMFNRRSPYPKKGVQVAEWETVLVC